MLSVADGEMTDPAVKERAVNKDGFIEVETDSSQLTLLDHSSSVFLRCHCVVDIDQQKIIVPEELPTGVQLRVATIVLMRSIILGYSEQFFDAEWIGTFVQPDFFLI